MDGCDGGENDDGGDDDDDDDDGCSDDAASISLDVSTIIAILIKKYF